MQTIFDLSAINIRDCHENDYEFIHNLSRRNMENYVKKFWGGWDEKNFVSKIKKNNIKIIEHNGKSIGFLDSEIVDNLAYLHNLQIEKSFQSKKIGRYVLLNAEQNIKNSGIKRIRLQVFKDNPAKIFYEKFGYIVIRDNKNSLIMEKNLN